jgi:MerR family Zn(II)-responsive transcriptional regulator of zntA
MTTITISELAGSMGLRADTLRYYERIGLLKPAQRSDAGYRLYDDASAQRLRFIKGLQRMGLHLGDIKELLDVRDRGGCPCGHTEVLVERRLAEVQAEIQEMEDVQAQLLVLKERNTKCMGATVEDWSCAINPEKGGGT